MTVFVLQTLLLVFLAYVLGVLIGFILFRIMGRKSMPAPMANAMPATARQAPVAIPADTTPVPREAAAAPPAQTVSKAPPVAKQTPAPKTSPDAKDDLKKIKGIGPQIERKLNAYGIFTYADIAKWTSQQEEEFGTNLSFPGRVERDEWVKQATILAAGGETDFSARVERGEVESSAAVPPPPPSNGTAPATLDSAPAEGGDDLTLIGGIGNALEKKLNAIGIYTFDQVAKWNASNSEWIGDQLGFPGRPERENWSQEAAALAKGERPTSDKNAKSNRGVISAKRKN